MFKLISIYMMLLFMFTVAAFACHTQKIALKIEGMSCQDCAEKVATALKNVKGVTNVIVNLDEGIAFVENNGAKYDDLKKAVILAGFTSVEDENTTSKTSSPKDESMVGCCIIAKDNKNAKGCNFSASKLKGKCSYKAKKKVTKL